MRILRRGGLREEPQLFLDGDQPTIYRKKRIRWKSVLKWGALVLVALLLVGFVWGYVWIKSKESRMRLQGVDEALAAKKKGQPVNTLVMGVDRGSVPGEGGSGRSDIMMLVSVSSDGKKAAVISIPRDTRLKIPGRSGYDKINAAHAYGGPRLAIETVKSFTGLDINHYVEIDFEGFKHIVNAVGGVRMQIDKAIHDKFAGDVPAGDVVLNGDQALALVRARHDVKTVPAGDLDRIKNQRRFLQAMLSTVSRQRNPFRLKKLVDVASSNIKTDLTFAEMLSLGRKLQGLSSNGLQMATAPGAPKVMGGVWYYIVDADQFQAMLSTFKSKTETDQSGSKGQTGGVSRSGVRVKVLNGSGVAGLAASVSKELEQKGYVVAQSANAKNAYSRTTIYYSGDVSSQAGIVATDLESAREPAMNGNSDIAGRYGVEVLVVLGSDYRRI
jgi:LCP family protein required for cell wall assembly